MRKSGKLDFRACDLTGSTEEHMKIWIVPVAMTSHIDRDTKAAAAVNEDAATLEDLRELDKMSICKGETDQLQDELPTTTTAVKSEPPPSPDKPKSPEELEKEDLEKFAADAPTLYRRSCS